MRSRWAVLATLVFLPLAGCFGGSGGTVIPDPEQDPDWAVRAIYLDQDPLETGFHADHDHGDRSIHRGLSTPNFEIVSYTPLIGSYYGRPAGTHYCADVMPADGGERRLAVVHSHVSDVAVDILDVTDPDAPEHIGQLVLPNVFIYDTAIFSDGRYLALVGSPILPGTPSIPPVGGDLPAVPATDAADSVPLQPVFRSACSGEEEPVESQVDTLPRGYSTILVDLADPTRPAIQDFFIDHSRNMHSISVATIDDTRYVVSSSLNRLVPCVPGYTLPVPQPCLVLPQFGNLASHFNFFTVEDVGGLGARLVPHTFYYQADAGNPESLDPDLLGMGNFHVDANLQKHPITGETIAYMANWDGGLIIARLDGPGEMTHLATWGVADDDRWGRDMTGNIHSAIPLWVFDDGRHYTLAGQEVTSHLPYRPTGEVVLLDTTDPTTPTPVARWTLPIDVRWSGCCTFSPHYPITQDGFLFVPLYHGGVWAADMRPDAWPELPSVGVFLPDMDPPEEPVTGRLAPEVREVLPLGDGLLLVFDGTSGAYIVRFAGYHPDVPPAKPWVHDAWIGRR